MKKYIVGGWVRDQLLSESGRKLKTADRDWVVTGATPEEMLRRGFQPVGSDFPVFLHPATHEEYALARTERKSGHGYKGFVFFADPTVTLEEDLQRRDLTINAMAMDDEGRLYDPFGGRADLEAKVLRHVSEAFEEDPLRILRLARFHAKLPDFSVDPETSAMARRMVLSGETDHLVPERVAVEIRKALKEPKPSVFFTDLADWGYLPRVFPGWRRTERALNLLDSLDESFDEEDRFAAAVADVPPEELTEVLDKLRIPKKMAEFAALFVQSLNSEMEAASDSKTILKILRRKDAMRRPERFEKLLRLLTKIGAVCNAPMWISALNALKAVDFRSISAETDDKKLIPRKIEEASLKAIDSVLDKLSDQHQDNGNEDSAG